MNDQAFANAGVADEHVLILRTCNRDMKCCSDASNHAQFNWPTSGTIVCPDWNPDSHIDCGQGFHGLLYGVGDNSHLSRERDAKWLVIRSPKGDVVDSATRGKVRFGRGEVIYCGAMAGAYALVNAELLKQIQEASKGAAGQHAEKEKEHAAATGYSGHAAATGHSGHAAATGDSGHAAATGNSGHAAATGNSGTAFAGFHGKARASAKGAFAIAWFDRTADRARLIVGTPGENGILPDAWYRVDENGQLVEDAS